MLIYMQHPFVTGENMESHSLFHSPLMVSACKISSCIVQFNQVALHSKVVLLNHQETTKSPSSTHTENPETS